MQLRTLVPRGPSFPVSAGTLSQSESFVNAVHFLSRCPVPQGLVGPFLVVEAQVSTKKLSQKRL